MQIVAADVGNSSIKYVAGQVHPESRQFRTAWPEVRNLELSDLSHSHGFCGFPAHWFVSSVNDHNMQTLKAACQSANELLGWHLIERSEVPLALDLETPDKVGIDRLLAAFAAHQLYGAKRDVIVIDCGTAMTIDLVTCDGTYRGGVIMAGPGTILRALNSRTSALPDLSDEPLLQPARVPGKSTREAMLNGAWFSGLGAVKEVVIAFQDTDLVDPLVVGTGGGLGPWRSVLPQDWKLVEDLVLDGIFGVANQLIRDSIVQPDVSAGPTHE